ncbi:MAG: hypothetical protein JXB48_14090 [Candidatus Latescibacteria bacterium]|nr:hypothetical protein [Candidatus Latescibacterota bacterium]
MGASLLKYYDWIKQFGGMTAQMRLAMKSGIPSAKAGTIPDTPDAVTKMHNAAKEVSGQEPPKF